MSINRNRLPFKVCLYVSGKPVDFEADDLTVAALENYAVDVTVPLLGGKVGMAEY